MAVHLVVAQHGLWGNPSHLQYLLNYLEKSLASNEQVVILNSPCSVGNHTYDGIDVCGDRLVDAILQRIQQEKQEGRQVVKVSFIGYSLGGLILRYAAGKLLVMGVFNTVKPMNFISIATPHLGSFRWVPQYCISTDP